MKKIMSLLIVMVLFLLVGCSKSNEVKTFRVVFDSDGGTKVKSQIVEDGKSAVKPISPTKEGYSFDGWYLDDTEFDFRTVIIKNITLKAKWNVKNTCKNTCKKGYTLDDKCKCIKKTTTKKATEKNTITTTKKATTKKVTTTKTTTKTKDYLVLAENNITLIEGSTIKLDVIASKSISYASSDRSIADIINGEIKAYKQGITKVQVTSGDLSDYITVTVITKDRENIGALKSIMKPKMIDRVGNNIMYSYSGCNVVNTANVLSNNISARINNGVITYLSRNYSNGTITSAYSITCGNLHDNVVVEHTVLAY